MPGKKPVKRTRNYATVVYPESAPEGWLDVLTGFHVASFVSPLHDQDMDFETGEQKKPHYHVMIMFDNVKTPEQAAELFAQIGGVGLEYVNSMSGYARYLCHLDDPEKHRYNVEDVQSFCGADYAEVIALPSDKYNVLRDICTYCMDNHIVAYADVALYCMTYRLDWWRVLCDSGSYVVDKFLKSYSWRIRQECITEK